MTNRNIVTDTGALTLFFAGDPRVRPYYEGIIGAKTKGHISSVTLAEYFYKTCQKLGRETATTRYHMTRAMLNVIETDSNLSMAVGLEKCMKPVLSLADCYALALTKRMSGKLLTTDRELSKVKDADVKYFEVGRI